VPIAYDLKGSVGELKSSIAGIQKTIDIVEGQVKTLVLEKWNAETDPKALLTRQGIPVAEGYSFAYVNGSIVVFPTTAEAEGKLISVGYHKKELTPVISGYVVKLLR
jgi:hypothetical protein